MEFGHTLKMHAMNPVRWLSLAALLLVCAWPAQAQERIYRCGNAYTNIPDGTRGCVLHEGGNITIVRGTVPQRVSPTTKEASAATPTTAPRPARPGAAPAAQRSGERVDASAQRARDSDARTILEAELRRAQERLVEAQKAYANGEPEKQGIESRDHQRYLDRVAERKAALTRAQVDVDSLRRELARFGASLNASATP